MKLRKAMYGKLAATASITSLLGTNTLTGDRDLYLESNAPESATLPRITMQVTQRDRVRHMTSATGLVEGRVGLVISAAAPFAADAVAEAIRLAFNDQYTGGTIGSGDSAVTVSTIYVDNDFDNTLDPVDGDGSPIYQRIMELVVWYRESVT